MVPVILIEKTLIVAQLIVQKRLLVEMEKLMLTNSVTMETTIQAMDVIFVKMNDTVGMKNSTDKKSVTPLHQTMELLIVLV